MSWALIVVGLALLAFALYLIFDLHLWASDQDEPRTHELLVERVRRLWR